MKMPHAAVLGAILLLTAISLAQTTASSSPSATPARLGLKFSGCPDADTFAINYADTRIPTQFLKNGSSIFNTQYIIIGYSAVTKRSILLIEHTVTHAKIQLELGKLTWVDP